MTRLENTVRWHWSPGDIPAGVDGFRSQAVQGESAAYVTA